MSDYPKHNEREHVLEWARARIASQPVPDFTIGPADDPQLQRWWIVPRNEVANVYLHCFMRSDDDRALHDHPWQNTSWILDGEYMEHTPDGTITRHQGERVTRPAEAAHRVELVTGPVITLFFTGPIIREWGFHCLAGWRHWKEFVSTYPGGNTISRGCE